LPLVVAREVAQPAGPLAGAGPAPGMRDGAGAFDDPLMKLLDRGRVLGSAPSEERGIGQTMPRTQKSSGTPAAAGKKGSVPSGRKKASPASGAVGVKKGSAAVKAGKTTNTVKAVKKASPASKKPAAAVNKTVNKTVKKTVNKTAASGKRGPATTAKPAKKQPAARVSGRTPPVPPPARAAQKRVTDTDDKPRAAFLAEQRTLLLRERDSYTRQAEELKAEADSLALEHEPGDVQFDEEGGEGGTSNVDRELDLVLSAQALGAIAEIDRALAKINAGTYSTCEQCGNPIPQARLKALPYAALCVACKSGGLSRR
jgi:DnaK suppressor protein